MLDTHAVARSLTDAEFTPAQADAITNAVRLAAERGDHVTSDQFTAGLAGVRTEIAEVRTEIANLDTRLSTQIADLRTEQKTEPAPGRPRPGSAARQGAGRRMDARGRDDDRPDRPGGVRGLRPPLRRARCALDGLAAVCGGWRFVMDRVLPPPWLGVDWTVAGGPPPRPGDAAGGNANPVLTVCRAASASERTRSGRASPTTCAGLERRDFVVARCLDWDERMDAEALKALYERRLAEALEPPSAGGVDRRAARRFLDVCRRTAPGTLRVRNERSVWVWSDLHLGIAEGIGVFGRPFGGPEEMDDALFGSWRRAVDPDGVIICLGDVPLPGLFGRRLRRLRAAPGRKVLVLGNHDAGVGGVVAPDGFDEVYNVLHVPGETPLLMTHAF